MNLIEIDNPDDLRLHPYRDVRERDLVRQGDFIAEGAVVLDHLLTSPMFEATSLLVSQHRINGLLPRLHRLQATIPVYVAAQAVMDRIAGFSVHRGILAHGRRIKGDHFVDIAVLNGPLLATVGISNHDNMGSLFRNAAAFGAAAVLLDDASCDPLYRKSIRVSVGTVLKVPFYRAGTASELARQLRTAGFQCLALSPAGRQALHEWRPGAPDGRIALLLGSEGEGLPASVMDECDTIRIAMAPGVDSLNVATSAAIAMHHIFTSSSAQFR